jgi:hypothetical protein
MSLFWRKVFQSPQTYLLWVAIGVGLSVFFHGVGLYPLSLAVGGFIALGMLLGWLFLVYRQMNQNQVNLFDGDNFTQRLKQMGTSLGSSPAPEWKTAQNHALGSQQLCQGIAQRESILTPELLETLYTILNLCEQVVNALIALDQVKTDHYRILARNHLQTSLMRLKTTHQNLQKLQDQTLVSALNHTAVNTEFPLYLQELVQENRSALETILQDSLSNPET